jgi:hypothetical protein
MDIYTVVSREYVDTGVTKGIRYAIGPRPPEKWSSMLASDLREHVNPKLPGVLHADAQPQTFTVWGMSAGDLERVEPLLIGALHSTNVQYEQLKRMGTNQEPQFFAVGSDDTADARSRVQGAFRALPPLDED